MKIVYTGKALQNPDKSISSAITGWQGAQRAIQVANVAILYALYTHKDTDTTKKRVTTLIDGTKGVNTIALVEWFVQMGFKFDKDGVTSCPDNATIEAKAGDHFKDAKTLHWFDLKPISPYKGFDLKGQLVALVKNAKGATKKVEEDPSKAKLVVVPAELLAALEVLAA
jgi:hypothetical protein